MTNEHIEQMQEELSSLLYEQRMIVLLETSPQSNEYRQVLLGAKHFKVVSDAVVQGFVVEALEDGAQRVHMQESEYTITLPDTLASVHEKSLDL